MHSILSHTANQSEAFMHSILSHIYRRLHQRSRVMKEDKTHEEREVMTEDIVKLLV